MNKRWTHHEGLTKELCKELFHYSDGQLIRKVKVSRTGQKGDIAGSKSSNGYLTLVIMGKRTCAHRVVFLMHHGYLPKIVDHINGIKDDNRIENLRASDYSMNGFSHRQPKANKTSIYRGVCWSKKYKVWESKIKHKGKTYRIGGFDDEKDAALAYDKRATEIAGDHAILNFPK